MLCLILVLSVGIDARLPQTAANLGTRILCGIWEAVIPRGMLVIARDGNSVLLPRFTAPVDEESGIGGYVAPWALSPYWVEDGKGGNLFISLSGTTGYYCAGVLTYDEPQPNINQAKTRTMKKRNGIRQASVMH